MSADELMEIVGADFRDGRELIVEFSDGTTTVYSVEQLRELRPKQSVSRDVELGSERTSS
jgi:hypothetical protein